MTTILTTKRVNNGRQYILWRTDYITRLLIMDTGGQYSLELENRQG